MSGSEKLTQRLQQIEAEIHAAEDQLPAHSVKPVFMQQIFELEEERETILEKLRQDSVCPEKS